MMAHGGKCTLRLTRWPGPIIKPQIHGYDNFLSHAANNRRAALVQTSKLFSFLATIVTSPLRIPPD
jgi:hypothetical protein